MTEGEALYRAILANPADDTPRLVYADWLQEHGQDDWAEFVRVQCELETTDERRCGGYYCQTYDTGNTMHVDCRWEYLSRRQRELWPAVVQQVPDLPRHEGLAWVTTADWIPQSGTENWGRAVVRRGFVAEVHLPVAAYCGAACERCDVAPGVRRYATHSGDWIEDECNECYGRGWIEGVARRVLAAHPVERVRLTDRSPHRTEPMSGFPSYYGWGPDIGPTIAQPWSRLPKEVFGLLRGYKTGLSPYYSSSWRFYDTAADAWAAASAALIARPLRASQ